MSNPSVVYSQISRSLFNLSKVTGKESTDRQYNLVKKSSSPKKRHIGLISVEKIISKKSLKEQRFRAGRSS